MTHCRSPRSSTRHIASPRSSAPRDGRVTNPPGSLRDRLRRRLSGDDGTITILLVGVLVVLLLVIGMGVAVTGVHLQRTELQNVADGAALAAAESIESPGFYNGQAPRGPSRASAHGAAQAYVSTHAQFAPVTTDVQVAEVHVGADGTARVTVTARTRPPLVGWFMRATGTSIPLTTVGEAHAN